GSGIRRRTRHGESAMGNPPPDRGQVRHAWAIAGLKVAPAVAEPHYDFTTIGYLSLTHPAVKKTPSDDMFLASNSGEWCLLWTSQKVISILLLSGKVRAGLLYLLSLAKRRFKKFVWRKTDG